MGDYQAYLADDEAVLSQHCTPSCVNRLRGIIQAERAAEVWSLAVSGCMQSCMLAAPFALQTQCQNAEC